MLLLFGASRSVSQEGSDYYVVKLTFIILGIFLFINKLTRKKSLIYGCALLVATTGLAAFACAGVDTGSASAFRVALLTPGPISDQSWNAGAYAGLMRIRDSLGAQTSHIQVKTPADFEENFRQYGASGYTLVFGHGFEFQDAAKRVALYEDLQKKVQNSSPFVFMLQGNDQVVISDKVKNYVQGLNADQVYYDHVEK